ncbi:uncharacterized protein LOC118388311 [Oncorhynchus keta]|uniref:uncharacterized protein LOC118388311 n=1 Tax=Oncorhynchus keta TaxID=8018 RepID=UPI0015F8AB68|nr:uncharacterized protein LOC118388311 [Oncorhynchus keta]XP_052382539.1 uncharacterized protein LOC118388311 [Oncorhynchus keta]
MDGVLEGAAVVCVCKLACSLLFLPMVTASLSAVSFCCNCLLLFTDLVVTTFLVVLWFTEPWLPQFSMSTDVIALRFLLFLSYIYWAVLLMTTPLVAVETAMRLQWPQVCGGGAVDGDVDKQSKNPAPHGGVTLEVENWQSRDTDTQIVGREDQDQGSCLSHIIGFFCCLLVWAVCGICGGQGWRLEVLWVEVCLERTSSLTLCLPSLPNTVQLALGEPSWGLATVTLALLLVLTVGWGFLRRHLAHTETNPHTPTTTQTHKEEHGTDIQLPVQTLPAPRKAMKPVMSVASAPRFVDTETTWSRCSVHSPCSGNNMQLSLGHHVLLSLEFLSADRLEGHKEKKGLGDIPLTGIVEEHTDRSQHGLGRFPCLGVNIMTGLMCLLTVCVLPLNLSVNILLIRHTETMLQWSLKILM